MISFNADINPLSAENILLGKANSIIEQEIYFIIV